MTGHDGSPNPNDPDRDGSGELTPAAELLTYLHGKFIDALTFDAAAHDRSQQSGFYTQEEWVPLDDDLTVGTRRILLEDPYPNRDGIIWEAFLPINQLAKADDGYHVWGKVYIRRIIDDVSQPLMLADELGVSLIDGEAAWDDPKSLLAAASQDSMALAKEVHAEISHRNLISFND